MIYLEGFYNISEDRLKRGKSTDIYFKYTKKILKEKDINPKVALEVTASSRGIFTGLEEVLNLMKGKNVDISSMKEGTFFKKNEPVMRIEGNYLDICIFETTILGFICQSSGIATKAAKIKKIAGNADVLSFGTRRMYPSIAPMIERSAYIGGADGISNTEGGRMIGVKAKGTMPHSLILCFGSPEGAWKSYDEIINKEIPRVMLTDTFGDEKDEVLRAIKEVGDSLDAIRLDTPSSRRGNLKEIVNEIRWELDSRGFENVGIFVSGGIDEEEVKELRDIVDGFGVGTSISSASPIDFGMDIVEIENNRIAKKGKMSGKKQVYRGADFDDEIRLAKEDAPKDKKGLLNPVMDGGEILTKSSLEEIRKRVKENLKDLPLLNNE